MCVSAGARARELQGCSARPHHHGPSYPLSSRPSVAAAFSFSGGRQLSPIEASFPFPSPRPQCLRLPTPAGDPPPRTPLSKKPSPTLSSVSQLCSRLGVDPTVPDTAPSGNAPPRHELAAIALLSTVSLHSKACSASQMSPPKLSLANYRSSTPFPRSSPTDVSAAKGTLQTVASSSPSIRHLGNGDTRNTDYAVTRWSPQVASPVPRKSVSSVPPPRLSPHNLTVLNKAEQQGNLLQPQIRAPPRCPSQRIWKRHAQDASEVAANSSVGTPKEEVMNKLPLRKETLDRKICARRSAGIEEELCYSSSVAGNCKAEICFASGNWKKPPPCFSRQAAGLARLQRTSPATTREGPMATREIGDEMQFPCEQVLLQRASVPLCASRWPDTGTKEFRLPLRLATDTLPELAHPVGVSCFPAKTILSPVPCSSTDSCKRQRPYRAEWAEYISPRDFHVPAAAVCDARSSVVSKPNTLSSAPAEHRALEAWHTPWTQHLVNKHDDTEAQQAVICAACDKTEPRSSFSVQTSLSQACLSSPALPAHRALGGHTATGSLLSTERAGCAETLSGLLPQLTRSSVENFRHFPGLASAVLNGKLCDARDRTKHCAPCGRCAVMEPLGCAHHEMCTPYARPTCSSQDPTLTALGAVDSAGRRQVIAVKHDRATATDGYAGAPPESDDFPASMLKGHGDEEVQHSAARGNWRGLLKRWSPALGCPSESVGDGPYPCTEPGRPIGENSGKLSRPFLKTDYYAQGPAEEQEVVSDNSEEAYIFSELQHTLKELQEHTTALRAGDVVFGTTIPPELVLRERSPARRTGNRNVFETEEARLSTQACSVQRGLQHCMLEEGSFGKVFVGRFLGKLPTNTARRWWRTLPLCERFLQQASYPLPSPVTGLLPLHVQKAMERNVKVAIKVPVEAMMLRDPLGVLGRTLNEWKILELVQEKRKILFSEHYVREDAGRAIYGLIQTQTSESEEAAWPRELGSHNSNPNASANVPLVFCQEQLFHESLSSRASKSWHPMHPQAEPPGVVELVGGVVHGPLNVWLVTRLAAGKDLHTRKYSRRLAGGVSIPPAAGLAMCRQLAAIVDFLHASTSQALTRKCATVDAGSSCRRRRVQCLREGLRTFDGPNAPNKSVENYKGPCDRDGERELERNLGRRVLEVPVIVHRDIKPENIIVDDNWRIQLCDFGDAEATPDGVVSKISGATWLYAPVELLCAASLHDDKEERSSECEACRSCYPRRRQGDRTLYTNANRACCSSRAHSCPTLADAQNHVDESACHNSLCAGACVDSCSGSDSVLTEKWDIWSMGCVFQEMFGLPNPMSSYVAPTDPPQIIYEKLKSKAQNGQLVPVIAPEIQGIARRIIFACLRNDPEARPSATTVLRMWSAPEQEILNDIRLPFSFSALVHRAPRAQGPDTALRGDASLQEFLTFARGTDGRTALPRDCEDHDQKGAEDRCLTKSAPTCSHSDTLYSCMDCGDAATFSDRKLSGQEGVYMVPNMAVVYPSQCDFCVKRATVAT